LSQPEEALGPRVPAIFARPSGSMRYLLHARAFALGAAIHLTLPDAAEPGWLAPNAVLALGAALLFASGCLAGWVLIVVGVLWPLLVLGDQLTQSVYLISVAGAAIALWLGPAAGRGARLDQDLARVVRVLTLLTYAIAALHKLNGGFLTAEVSCASQGVVILARNWGIPAIAWPPLLPVWPVVFLFVEAGLPVLLRVRPLLGMIVGVSLHIPLTIIFAPAFAFVVTTGYVTLLREDELRALGRVLRERWRLVVLLGGGLGLGSFALYMRVHRVIYWLWSGKEVLLWMALVWLGLAWLSRGTLFRDAGAFREGRAGSASGHAVLALLVVLWLANAVTPYLGLQFHHTAAMLSNLRIDRGCWNSLVFPESMRLVEPYIRIDEARLDAAPAETVAVLEERLWTPESLRRARHDLCRAGQGPVAIRARWHGRRYDVRDLCRSWPFGHSLLPRWKGFQDNLQRECPQYCIH